MRDAITREPLQISREDGGWCGLLLPLSQVPQVQALLDATPVRYWVTDGSSPFGDADGFARIHFYPDTGALLLQQLLDAVP